MVKKIIKEEYSFGPGSLKPSSLLPKKDFDGKLNLDEGDIINLVNKTFKLIEKNINKLGLKTDLTIDDSNAFTVLTIKTPNQNNEITLYFHYLDNEEMNIELGLGENGTNEKEIVSSDDLFKLIFNHPSIAINKLYNKIYPLLKLK